MTRDDIIRMAREVGLATHVVVPDTVVDIFEKFANLVAAHEREECANIANAWQEDVLNPLYQCDCATAIRRRGEQ